MDRHPPFQHFLRELRRRRVFRTAAIYIVAAWVAVQAAQTLAPLLLLPDWVARAVLVLALVGFPVAVGLAWALEVTPEGIRRTDAPEATKAEGLPVPAVATSPTEAQPHRWAPWYVGVGILAALVAFVAYVRYGHRAAPAATVPAAVEAPSLAVLPFQNVSADPANEYFSDGVTEDLIATASKIPGLRVISRTSVTQYKHTTKTAKQIGRELGVAYVLEGSVQRAGNEVRITAQLIDTHTDEHVWADFYDRELKRIFELESDVANRVAGALRTTLTPEQKARLASAGTGSPTAYELYLRAQAYLDRPGGQDYRRFAPAIALLHQALQADPGYADAYAALARAFLGVSWPPVIRRDSTLAMARKALALDPRNARAHVALARLYERMGRFGDARAEARLALAANPSEADAMGVLVTVLTAEGHVDEALRWAHAAERVDPGNYLAAYWIARLYQLLGDRERTASALRRAIELAPDFPGASGGLASLLLENGDTAQADTLIRRLQRFAPDHPGTAFFIANHAYEMGRWSEAYAWTRRDPRDRRFTMLFLRAEAALALGRRPEADSALNEVERQLKELADAGMPDPLPQLQVYALRGDRERAVALIQRLRRDGWLYRLPDDDRAYAALERDPRYRAARAEMLAELARQRQRAEREGW